MGTAYNDMLVRAAVCSNSFGVELDGVAGSGGDALVAHVRRGAKSYALKVVSGSLDRERELLDVSSVRLDVEDAAPGTLLLEWAGQPLRHHPDVQPLTAQIVATLDAYHHSTAPAWATPVSQRLDELVRACERFAELTPDGNALLVAAKRASTQLFDTDGPSSVHGDAHLANMYLRDNNTVVLGDPDGLCGDGLFDYARLCVCDHHLLGGTVDDALTAVCAASRINVERVRLYVTIIAAANAGYRRHLSQEDDQHLAEHLARWVLTMP